jgi:hypothetical protein
MQEYLVQGTLTFPVSLRMKGGNESEVIEKVMKLLNSYNIINDSLDLQTQNGQLHKVDVHDVEVEWESIEEIDCGKEIKRAANW